FSTGIITHGQGPRNISQGTMTSKAVIRGVEKGTLVLVDGVPINQGGRYNLEDIPVESIDRVEVVRGGGAVLYGSEANGGVINIITKGKRANMVKAGFGNYGIQNYAASFQAGKLGFTAAYDHTGKINNISAPTETTSKRTGAPRGLYYNIKRGEHANFNARYDFNDDLYVTHTYGRNSDHYVYKYNGIDNPDNAGKEYKNVIHSTEENLTALHYTKNNFSVNAFYNRRDQKTKNASAKINKKKPQNFDPSSISHDESGYLDQTVGINLQNRWNFHKGSFMLGYEFQRDMQTKNASVTEKFYDRNVHSLFGQVAYNFTHATQANLNFRQTWTEADDAGNKYDKFTPEFVLMHHLDESTMVYGKVGQSFMLPTFSQLYGGGNIIGVPDLKPEKGMHYELGAKKSIGKNAYRVALYSYKIEDSIDAVTKDLPDVTYNNVDVKNVGIEFDWTRNQNENLSYRLGLTYSHPQKRDGKIDKDGVETKGEWHDYYGKLGFNAGIDYTRGKLTTAFHISYLGDRTRDKSPYASMKAQLFSDINFSYKANDNARFFLNIDNLFDRRDIISTSSSSFYNLGRNFMAGVEYKF
ncbi:MAG: TonB-dependent receptor, partial [Dialister sp.]|nr:TonB-dependent receptor [Dialister sp.]